MDEVIADVSFQPQQPLCDKLEGDSADNHHANHYQPLAERSVVVAVIIIVAPVSSSSDTSIVAIVGFCLINRHHDA